MHDVTTFEARLADAYDRFVTEAPVEVDAAAVARRVVGAGARGGGLRLAFGRRQTAIVGVALLTLALVAGGLIVAALRETPPLPRVYLDRLVAGPDLLIPRSNPLAVTLLDGRVLIVGGDADNEGMTSAELLDPASNTSEPIGSRMSFPTSAVLLRDGRVLVVGVATAHVFEPATATFREVGPMIVPRLFGRLVALRDGRVLLVGGADPNDPETPALAAELFDPSTNTFTQTGSLAAGMASGDFLYHEVFAPVVLPDGRILVIGPPRETSDAGIWQVSAQVYDPETGSFADGGLTEMSSPRLGNAVQLPDGRVVAFADGGPAARVWSGGAFSVAPSAGSGVGSASVLDDGRILVIHRIYGSVGFYDPDSGFTELASKPRDGLTAVRLRDGRLLLLGGFDDDGEGGTAATQIFE